MDEALAAELTATDTGFRDLLQQHSEFDRKLSELMEKPYRSADDEVEETRLKKQKLMLKDQMEARRASWHSHTPVTA